MGGLSSALLVGSTVADVKSERLKHLGKTQFFLELKIIMIILITKVNKCRSNLILALLLPFTDQTISY